MKTKAKIMLFPGFEPSYGGINPSVAEKTYEIDINTPQKLSLILRGVFEHEPKWFSSFRMTAPADYDVHTNTFHCVANMNSVDPEYIQKLKNDGWVFDPKAMAHYNLQP